MVAKILSYQTDPDQIPFSTYEWVRIWHETIGKEWDPYILSVNDTVIAPFARKKKRNYICRRRPSGGLSGYYRRR